MVIIGSDLKLEMEEEAGSEMAVPLLFTSIVNLRWVYDAKNVENLAA